MILKVKKLYQDSILPTRAYGSGSAGIDLTIHSIEDKGDNVFICKTGIAIQGLPEICYARVAAKSGVSVKQKFIINAGVVDSSYTGEIGVVVYSPTGLKPETGKAIAQLIIERIEIPDIVEVDSLEDTERGSKGFGSSGYLSTDCTKNGTSELTVTNNDMIEVYNDNKELMEALAKQEDDDAVKFYDSTIGYKI